MKLIFFLPQVMRFLYFSLSHPKQHTLYQCFCFVSPGFFFVLFCLLFTIGYYHYYCYLSFFSSIIYFGLVWILWISFVFSVQTDKQTNKQTNREWKRIQSNLCVYVEIVIYHRYWYNNDNDHFIVDFYFSIWWSYLSYQDIVWFFIC